MVKCRPPGQPRPPAGRDRDLPARTSRRSSSSSAPRCVVTLGNFATKLLLETKEGITKLRGQEFPFGDDAVLIPAFHPSAVLRNGGAALAQARADFVTDQAGARALAGRLMTTVRTVTRTAERDARARGGLGALVHAGDVVLLAGDLGAGKTVFAKGRRGPLGVTEPS